MGSQERTAASRAQVASLDLRPISLTPIDPTAKRAALSQDQLPPATSEVERSLFECWGRSRALGVDADGRRALEEAIVDAERLRSARDRTDPIERHARTILEDFGRLCADRDFVAVLADAEGVATHALGGGAFLREAKRLRLIEGAIWDEAIRGTNAIGTALAVQRTVAVHGAAHYARVNEGLVCFAAPIRDPHGEIVAVLDATSHAECAAAMDASVVSTVARSIEEVLRAYAYARVGGLDLVERIMERTDSPTFLVEAPGRIARANRAGRAHLAVNGRAALPTWEELLATAGSPRGASAHAYGAEELAVEGLLGADGSLLALLVFLSPHAGAPPARPATVHGPALSAGRQALAFASIVGHDPDLHEARERSARLAGSELPVLLLAETGTGKELFARAIHAASHRAEGPFVALNCGTLQSNLLQSELFGYGPGAFTGANARGREGRIAAAAGGTLFLDEVADLPLEAQVSLLRVLEDGTYMRVGEDRTRRADIRVVAATCRDLPTLVASGEFRQDLYFRIGGATVTLPPLRRREDFDVLVDALWSRIHADGSLGPTPELSAAVRAALAAHDWPGNVRELESALRFAALMAADSSAIELDHMPPNVSHTPADLPAEASAPGIGGGELDRARRTSLERALAASGGNVSAAARQLGVARSTVYRMARRYGIHVPQQRG